MTISNWALLNLDWCWERSGVMHWNSSSESLTICRTGHCGFVKLPLELREAIYELNFEEFNQVNCFSKPGPAEFVVLQASPPLPLTVFNRLRLEPFEHVSRFTTRLEVFFTESVQLLRSASAPWPKTSIFSLPSILPLSQISRCLWQHSYKMIAISEGKRSNRICMAGLPQTDSKWP